MNVLDMRFSYVWIWASEMFDMRCCRTFGYAQRWIKQ